MAATEKDKLNYEDKIAWPAKDKKGSRVVLILSGGMDSAVLLRYLSVKKKKIYALTFDYGSRHNRKEIAMAKKIAKSPVTSHEIVKLPFFASLFKSALLKGGGKIPHGHYMDKSMKKTVVPFRNGILLSIATGFAENLGIKLVMLGSHAGDHPIYPDCRLEFTRSFSKAASFGTYNEVEVLSPFNRLDKRDIGDLGRSLGLEFRNTWTCYEGLKIHCGKCGSCVERKYGLRHDEGLDPTVYAG